MLLRNSIHSIRPASGTQVAKPCASSPSGPATCKINVDSRCSGPCSNIGLAVPGGGDCSITTISIECSCPLAAVASRDNTVIAPLAVRRLRVGLLTLRDTNLITLHVPIGLKVVEHCRIGLPGGWLDGEGAGRRRRNNRRLRCGGNCRLWRRSGLRVRLRSWLRLRGDPAAARGQNGQRRQTDKHTDARTARLEHEDGPREKVVDVACADGGATR